MTRELTTLQRERISEWLRLGDDERADDAIVKITSATGRPIATLNAAWLKSLVVDGVPAGEATPQVLPTRAEVEQALDWWGKSHKGGARWVQLRGADGTLGPQCLIDEPFLDFLLRSYHFAAPLPDGGRNDG
jgi:hypothetical protein